MSPAASRRWPVITALGLVEIFAWGSSYYLLAVFAPPIAADTGWSLSWIVAGLSLGLFVAGIASPRIGLAIRRYGGRQVMAASSVLLALGLLILATAPTLYVFVLGWAVLGLGMGAGLYDAAFGTLGGIYGREARSAITAVTLWGGFASTVCWPLSALLIEHLGWRWACGAYAALHLGLCLPLLLCVLPRHAKPAPGAVPTTSKPELIGAERGAFLLVQASIVLSGLTVAIFAVHLLTILQGRGLSLAEAVAIGAVFGPAQVAARLIEMLSGGKHHPVWTFVAAAALSLAGLVILALGLPAVGLGVFLFGAGNGIYSIARGSLPLSLFGPERYAPIMGRLARPVLIAQALAPTIGVVLLSVLGREETLGVLAGLSVVTAVLVGLLVRHLRLSGILTSA